MLVIACDDVIIARPMIAGFFNTNLAVTRLLICHFK